MLGVCSDSPFDSHRNLRVKKLLYAALEFSCGHLHHSILSALSAFAFSPSDMSGSLYPVHNFAGTGELKSFGDNFFGLNLTHMSCIYYEL